MSYKNHIDTINQQLKDFADNKEVDKEELINQLEGVIQDIENAQNYVKWDCNSCGHHWYAGHFDSYIACPVCPSGDIGSY